MYYIQKSITQSGVTTDYYYDGIGWTNQFHLKFEHPIYEECQAYISVHTSEDSYWTDATIKPIIET